MRKIHWLFPCILMLLGCTDDDAPSNAPQKPVRALPLISICTTDSLPIVSRDFYIDGDIEISNEFGEIEMNTNVEIRGRGNSTWKFPKKPYQIKFDEPSDILEMPKDKRWILLANYSDKSMLRNEVAFDLSRFSNLDWTPESRFVELSVNNEYLGVYQLTQKVEQSPNRVNIGTEGFLLEVDQASRLDADDVYFETAHHLFAIKEPSVNQGDEAYTYIEEYIQSTEKALFGDNFKDISEGYAKYIDVDSFVDWYLINEITKNNDAIFFSSVFLNYIPGNKLKMGPVWDYDLSLGNINYNDNETPTGFWIKNADWYSRLFEDPDFVEKVKSRFTFFYDHRELGQQQINANISLLDTSVERNFERWPILGTYVWPNNVFFPTYEEETEYLKSWLDQRMEWLHDSFEAMNPSQAD